VCLVTGGLTKEQHYDLSKWVHAVEFHSELPAPVGIQDNGFHQINRAKVVLWTLVTYEKVIYIDADSIVTENPRHLFSELDGDFHMSPGPRVPVLGNWFMLRPSLQAFYDMRSIVRTRRWTPPDNGWLDCGPLNLAALGSKWAQHDWDFWGLYGDQGLLLCYFFCFKETGHLLNQKLTHVIHFGGPKKPWRCGNCFCKLASCTKMTPSGSVRKSASGTVCVTTECCKTVGMMIQ
jgi:hypothetical protein